jgi:hypothetical protein
VRRTILLSLALATSCPSAAKAEPIKGKPGPIVNSVLKAIKEKDEAGYAKVAGDFVLFDNPGADAYEEMVEVPSFFGMLQGCDVVRAYEPKSEVPIVRPSTKSFGNGLITWVCKGKVGEKGKCFDQAFIAAIRQYKRGRIFHVLYVGKSSEYSEERCGKRVIDPSSAPTPSVGD